MTVSTFINGIGIGFTARETQTLLSAVQDTANGATAILGLNSLGTTLITILSRPTSRVIFD